MTKYQVPVYVTLVIEADDPLSAATLAQAAVREALSNSEGELARYDSHVAHVGASVGDIVDDDV